MGRWDLLRYSVGRRKCAKKGPPELINVSPSKHTRRISKVLKNVQRQFPRNIIYICGWFSI
jgi:hypothetical protein